MTVRLALEGPPQVALGEVVRGTVRVLTPGVPLRELRASLMWVAASEGAERARDQATTVATIVLTEEGPAPDGPQPFALRLAEGPVSTAGKLVEVRWYAAAVLTWPDGRQELVSERLEVGPAPGPPADVEARVAALRLERAVVERTHTGDVDQRQAAAGLVWGLGAGALAWPGLASGLGWGPGLAAAVGLGGAVGIGRVLADGWITPRLPVPAWEAPVVPIGGTLSVALTHDGAGPLQWWLTATYRVREPRTVSHRGSLSTRLHVEDVQIAFDDGRVEGAGEVTITARVPEGAPSQVVKAHRVVVWALWLRRQGRFGREATAILPVIVPPWRADAA